MTLQSFLRKTLLWAMIILALGLVAFKLIGGSVHFVATGSMVPTLPVHTLAFDLPAGKLKVGDVVTFQQPGMPEPVTHRINNLDGSTMITKGDANPSPDNPATPFRTSDVIGKVIFNVPVLSSSFWLSLPGIGTGVVALLFLLLAFGPRIKRDDTDEEPQSDKKREATLESHPV